MNLNGGNHQHLIMHLAMYRCSCISLIIFNSLIASWICKELSLLSQGGKQFKFVSQRSLNHRLKFIDIKFPNEKMNA